MSTPSPRPPRWHSLGAFRGCNAHAAEHGINYTADAEAHGPEAVAAMIDAGERAGMLCPPSTSSGESCPWYATLDVRAENGDIVADRCIPTPEAFDWWVRAVELRPEMSDCPVDTPEAHAATYAFADHSAAGQHDQAAAVLLGLVHGGAR